MKDYVWSGGHVYARGYYRTAEANELNVAMFRGGKVYLDPNTVVKGLGVEVLYSGDAVVEKTG